MKYVTCSDCGHSYCRSCELACPMCGCLETRKDNKK